MKLKSKILLSLLATSSAAFAQTAPAAPESTIAYNIGVVSQYRYRGLDANARTACHSRRT